MFFEASRFGCRKSIFNATKSAYSMYSCTISGMSREMMKMGGRNSAEYEIWEIEGHKGHFGNLLNENKTKH